MTEKEKNRQAFVPAGRPRTGGGSRHHHYKNYTQHNNLIRWSAKRRAAIRDLLGAVGDRPPWNNRYFAPMATTSPWGPF